MIMAWQGKNIPQSYSSIALFQTPGYIGVAFLLYVTTLSSGAQAGEYFNPHLLEVTESSATAVDLSGYLRIRFLPAVIIWIFIY